MSKRRCGASGFVVFGVSFSFLGGFGWRIYLFIFFKREKKIEKS
jgi:hypothetical protein